MIEPRLILEFKKRQRQGVTRVRWLSWEVSEISDPPDSPVATWRMGIPQRISSAELVAILQKLFPAALVEERR